MPRTVRAARPVDGFGEWSQLLFPLMQISGVPEWMSGPFPYITDPYALAIMSTAQVIMAGYRDPITALEAVRDDRALPTPERIMATTQYFQGIFGQLGWH
jgi:hypothetical protein